MRQLPLRSQYQEQTRHQASLHVPVDDLESPKSFLEFGKGQVDESKALLLRHPKSLAELSRKLNRSAISQQRSSLLLSKNSREEARLLRVVLVSLAAISLLDALKCNLDVITAACP
jgi:hypothetical protein